MSGLGDRLPTRQVADAIGSLAGRLPTEQVSSVLSGLPGLRERNRPDDGVGSVSRLLTERLPIGRLPLVGARR